MSAERYTADVGRHRDLVRELTADYAFSLDDQDFDALGNVFTDDATLDIVSEQISGRTAIVEWYRAYFAAAPGATGAHFITNHRFAAAADAAAQDELGVECYFMYTFRLPEQSIIGWGRYSAVARIADDRAQFARLKIVVLQQSDVREGWQL